MAVNSRRSLFGGRQSEGDREGETDSEIAGLPTGDLGEAASPHREYEKENECECRIS